MSTRTKNEICLAIWNHYKWLKDLFVKMTVYDASVDTFVDRFRHEIYLGAKVEQKEAFNTAAESIFSLSALQSLVLHAKRKLVVKARLRFAEALDQMQKPASSSIVLSATWTEEGEIAVKKTDGEVDFQLFASNPNPEFEVGKIFWVAEPFIPTGENQGKAWFEMTTEERTEANKTGALRAASTFPKYLQRRRVTITGIEIRNDDRETWIEYLLEETAEFDRQTFEEDALKAELGIEGVTEGDDVQTEEPTITPAIKSHEQGVDVTTLTEEEHTEAAEDAF